MRTAVACALPGLLAISLCEGKPGGPCGALIDLSDHGKLALEALRMERRGTLLFMFVNGRPIAELQIDWRVSDGKIYIASGLTSNDIALMKEGWPPMVLRKK